jgi:hypothetical protein
MPIRRSPNGARHVRPQPGRNRPERVVAINRNAWSQSVGTGGRNHPVRARQRRSRAALARVLGEIALVGQRAIDFIRRDMM